VTWTDGLGPSTVYRLWDDEDLLLYVGCTNDTGRRFAQHFPPHSRVRGWQAEVTRIATTPYPDRRSALQAEAQAILTEGPLYNDLRVVYRVHRQMFGPPRFTNQEQVIRERIARRLGADPGAWAYRRRQEATRIPFADLAAEIRDSINRYCTKDRLTDWALEFGPDPWGKAVHLSWSMPGWQSQPADRYSYADGQWHLP
jgi:hypothetical protein